MRHPGPIQDLVDELRRLPGIGQRTAQRLAFHLLRQDESDVFRLAEALRVAKTAIQECSSCCDLTDRDPCHVCADPSRDLALLCVVEEPQDLRAIERTGEYRGRYHVLHGALSPMAGVGPEALRIEELTSRLSREPVREIIVATNASIEGEATALYLTRLVEPLGVAVTRIAQGLPAGTTLDHVDELTMSRALAGRRPA